MMVNIRSRFSLLLICLACLTALLDSGAAQTTTKCTDPIYEIVEAKGSIAVKAISGTQFNPALTKMKLCPGDSIKSGPTSRATILRLGTGQTDRIDENSEIQLQRGGTIKLNRGALYIIWKRLTNAIRGEAPGLEIETPFVNGNVKGTEFLVRVEPDRTFFTVFEGFVRLTNAHGGLTLAKNQSAVALEGQAPQLRIDVRPLDEVRWTMYYPPVLPPMMDPAAPDTVRNRTLKESLEMLSEGNIEQAFERINRIPEADRSDLFYTYRAGLLLSVGQVDEARSDIDQALQLAPNSGDAYALKAVIAVAHNDHEHALVYGRKAVEKSPLSSTAKIALSYGLQANLKIEDARDVLLQAVEDSPNDGLAWARLGELELSLGNLDRALEAAQIAISMGPAVGRAHTVLGFSRLAQIKISESKISFEKALAIDPGSPLAYLGLGLARIRDGKLAEGRKDIEMAAALDPGDAIIRSYLGKAYFEEKRDGWASEQLNLAKDLDPLDPTPYFYDAIRKQTINRPVEALRDLQKSIELNDNRAVYRSQLLMDQDLAARSASLARIYRDLNYEHLALVEGWNSLNQDPANYSAHRFLSDSYSSLPRHEIARVSELLQSQLLQPINITPLQPQLSETNLHIINGAGPSDAAYNEYNPLFTRNRLAAQANVIAGQNNLFGDDIVFSGIQGKVSFSVGQYHYDDDGFRENNDQRRNIYNAFVQASLTYKTSVQAEFKYSDSNTGDLGLRFDPSNFNPTLREDIRTDSFRFGAHHAFSPHSDVIASVISQRDDYNTEQSIPGYGDITTGYDAGSYIVEGQYLYRSEHFNLVGGAGHYDSDGNESFEMPGYEYEGRVDEGQQNAYVYTQSKFLNTLALTVGVSFDSFRGSPRDRRQVNPKLGLTWKPFAGTTFRVAGFRTLKRVLVANQTIEPTQVAGFNQFFDDQNGADTRRIGAGLDHKFTPNLYAGAEISRRELRLVSPVFPLDILEDYKYWERLGRFYVYWSPHPWFAGTLDYQIERFDTVYPSGAIILNEETKLKTQRIPLGVNFYHPSGITAGVKVTYVEQEGTFTNAFQMEVSEKDVFWMTDASVGYRLPKRYGLISFGAKNLFNTEFQFQDTDPRNPSIYPERLVYGRITLAF